MPMGARRALVAAGNDKEVLVFGFDGARASLMKSVQAGSRRRTCSSSKTMAKTAAQFAHRYLQAGRSGSGSEDQMRRKHFVRITGLAALALVLGNSLGFLPLDAKG
jgi:ABC-type xylose transport system substrate-binding protein